MNVVRGNIISAMYPAAIDTQKMLVNECEMFRIWSHIPTSRATAKLTKAPRIADSLAGRSVSSTAAIAIWNEN